MGSITSAAIADNVEKNLCSHSSISYTYLSVYLFFVQRQRVKTAGPDVMLPLLCLIHLYDEND